MTVKNKIRVLGAGVVLAAGVLCPILVHRARMAQKALVAARAKGMQLEASTQEAARALADAEKTNRALLDSTQRMRDGQLGDAASKKQKDSAMVGAIGEFMKDPKLQTQYLAARRNTLMARYGPIFRLLGLEPQQIARCEELILAREEQRMDILNAVPGFATNVSYEGDPLEMNPLIITARQPAPGALLSADDRAAAQLLQQQDQAFQAAATDLLGTQGYQQLQQYDRTLPAREIVGNVVGALTSTSNPLSPDQANQLTQILADASSEYQQGGAADDLGHGNWSAHVDWDQALVQAKQVLSPEQLGSFSRIIGPLRTATEFDSTLRAAVLGRGPISSSGGAGPEN